MALSIDSKVENKVGRTRNVYYFLVTEAVNSVLRDGTDMPNYNDHLFCVYKTKPDTVTIQVIHYLLQLEE